jgi:hypothetical protein
MPDVLAAHIAARDAMQLVVDQRSQFVERRRIPAAEIHEQLGHFEAGALSEGSKGIFQNEFSVRIRRFILIFRVSG